MGCSDDVTVVAASTSALLGHLAMSQIEAITRGCRLEEVEEVAAANAQCVVEPVSEVGHLQAAEDLAVGAAQHAQARAVTAGLQFLVEAECPQHCQSVPLQLERAATSEPSPRPMSVTRAPARPSSTPVASPPIPAPAMTTRIERVVMDVCPFRLRVAGVEGTAVSGLRRQ